MAKNLPLLVYRINPKSVLFTKNTIYSKIDTLYISDFEMGLTTIRYFCLPINSSVNFIIFSEHQYSDEFNCIDSKYDMSIGVL